MAIGARWQVVAGFAVLLAWYLYVPSFFLSRRNSVFRPKSSFGLVRVEGFGELQGSEGVDLIFVHGLGSNPDTTWRAAIPTKESQSDSRVAWDYVWWVRDLLPEDIPPAVRENVRVFHYNHDSSYLRDAPQILLTGLGETLVHDLDALLGETRQKRENRKLVFVAYSYGGLVVKQALVHASAMSNFRHISSRTTGVIFLGTPHLGSEMAYWGRTLARALKAHGSNPDLLDEINLDSSKLRDLHKNFVAIFQNSLAVVNIYETRRTVWKTWGFYWSEMTVPERSGTYAGPSDRVVNYPFALNHFELNKYATRTYEYHVLSQYILKFLQPPRQDFFSVPVALASTFTPRLLLLDEIDEAITKALRSDDSSQVVVLHGLGGAGKSQLARQVLEDHRTSFKTVLWIDASSVTTIISSFARFLNDIGIHIDVNSDAGSSLSESTTIRKVTSWVVQHHSFQRRWIFVLDGADDLSKPEIEAITPKDANGTIMITSRNPHTCSKYMTGKTCYSILVGPLHTNESVSVISRHLKLNHTSLSAEIRNLSATIGEMLGDLALAVDIAGAYMSEQFFGDAKDALEMYVSDFLEHRDYLLKRKPFLEISEYDLTVWTVWDKSLDTISRKHPDVGAERLLTFLSGFDGSNIQDELFQLARRSFADVYPPPNAGYEPVPTWLENWMGYDNNRRTEIHLREAQALLARYSLVMHVEGTWPGIKIHNLVQWRARQTDNCKYWADWSAIFLLAVAHQVTHSRVNRQLRISLLAHLSAHEKSFPGALGRTARREDIWAARFIEVLAEFMLAEGKWTDAGIMFHRAGLIRQHQQLSALPYMGNSVRRNDYDSARLLSNLGSTLLQRGRWAEGAELLERALEIQGQDLGEDNAQTLFTMSSLAEAYLRLGRGAESVQLRIHILQRHVATFGEEARQTGTSLSNLGSSYLSLGDGKAAESVLLRSIEIAIRKAGVDSEEVLTPMANLAVAYTLQDRFEEAQALSEEVIERVKKTYDDAHYLTLRCISNLAYLHHRKGQLEQAESLLRYLLEARNKMQLGNHPETLENAAALATVLYETGRTDEAMNLLAECVALSMEALGPSHPSTIKFEEALKIWQHEPTLAEDFVLGLQIVFETLEQVITYLPLRIWRFIIYLRGEQGLEELWQSLTGPHARIDP
ncbi:hypothetical protein AYL99_01981 [Fonsecaea erecta]|uniref:NB-ARC domain-containing protein n=1 Tax=Fonsecaea erecta TaxID=1367422 RepID=A0A178ZSF2_9EURO|nr:hypothetical protein AYL99_01981 [Fonsecaea erecta]OAP62754.1 hypothetical protein AYL99_01981 [Fonsecaea erecta]